MTIANFLEQLFLSRDIAHSTHLSTRSYSKHMALDGFYKEIIPLADQLAEAWQGRNGLIGAIPLGKVKSASNITKFLQNQLKGIEDTREQLFGSDSTLQNIVDEIIALHLATIYKLKFLA